MTGSTARVTFNGPKRFVSTCALKSPGLISSKNPAMKLPALLTRTSTRTKPCTHTPARTWTGGSGNWGTSCPPASSGRPDDPRPGPHGHAGGGTPADRRHRGAAGDLAAHPVRDVRAPDEGAEVGEEVHRPRRDRNLAASCSTGRDQGRGPHRDRPAAAAHRDHRPVIPRPHHPSRAAARPAGSR
jgi:hypothetical protein